MAMVLLLDWMLNADVGICTIDLLGTIGQTHSGGSGFSRYRQALAEDFLCAMR
jgi:hypothetical protein